MVCWRRWSPRSAGPRGAADLRVDHFLHLRCEVSCPSIVELTAALFDEERTRLVSVMDHTPGQRQFLSEDTFRHYYKSKYHYSDAEIDAYMARRRQEQKLHSAPNRSRIVELAHSKSIPVASHDDATEAHVAEAVDDRIVVAEFPTTVEAARACRDAGLAVMMGAPNMVRGKSHSGNVSARDLAGQGLLDILSSDYVPYSLLFGATLMPRICKDISLPQAVAMVTRTPAARVGLDDRGEILPGRRADLVRYRMTNDLPAIAEVMRAGVRIA